MAVNGISKMIRKGLESFGKYYAIYHGFVVGHSEENPEYMVLKIPEVWGPTPRFDIWVKPEGMLGGYSWGEFGVPQPGEHVWVKFRNGNPAYPIWSKGYHADEEKPAEFLNSRTFGFKTPHGTYYQFDDDNDKFIFQHRFMEGVKPNMTIEDGTTIIIDKDDVIITHLDTEIKLTPGDININTKVPININSEKGINISSDEKIKFNGGNKKEMVLIDKLVEKINQLEEAMNNHKHPLTNIPVISVVPSTPPTVIGTASGDSGSQTTDIILSTTTENDIKNKDIIQ